MVDNLKMKKIILIFALTTLTAGAVESLREESDRFRPTFTRSENAAFYEGDSLAYVLTAPDRFDLVIDEAIAEGYSLAFIPLGQSLDSADVFITVSIFRIANRADKFSLEQFRSLDSAEIKKHYGPDVTLTHIHSVFNANGEELTTLYINDPYRFIPSVMVSYYEQSTEILIFELGINDGYPRVKAEDIFIESLSRFKVLVLGSLGSNR